MRILIDCGKLDIVKTSRIKNRNIILDDSRCICLAVCYGYKDIVELLLEYDNLYNKNCYTNFLKEYAVGSAACSGQS